MEPLEYKSLSRRARLLLGRTEGYDVDFKESASGLKSEDIVAFANSADGGAILIGVKEIKITGGHQRGVVVGCPVGDKDKLSILNRAESCIPSVEIRIIVENLNRKPFFRIEIPSGKNKPYATSGGTYKIRGNGRTDPLSPSRLLGVFIESESKEFVERFRRATKDLEDSLSEVKAKTLLEIEELYASLRNLEETLSDVFASASNTEALADDAMSLSDETLACAQDIAQRLEAMDEVTLSEIQVKVDALLTKLDVENPVVARTRSVAKERIRNFYFQGLRRQKLISQVWRFIPRASIPEITKWCDEVVREIKAETKSKKLDRQTKNTRQQKFSTKSLIKRIGSKLATG